VHTKKHAFHIREITNPGGTKAFQVSGVMLGRQIRRQFKDKSEATAAMYQLELERAKGPHERIFASWLPPVEVAGAETAVTLLREKFPNTYYSFNAVPTDCGTSDASSEGSDRTDVLRVLTI
jgi:hypothetical protein